MASANEDERLRKMAENGRKVNINKLTCDDDSSDDFSEPNSANSSSFSSASEQPGKKSNRAGKKGKNAAKSVTPSQQKQSENSKNDQNTFFTAEVSKITTALEKLSSTNAQLTADVNVLKQLTGSTAHAQTHQNTANQAHGLNVGNIRNGTSPLNPTAPGFSRQVRVNTTNRRIFLCGNCASANSSYCSHCFKCGRGDHKARECPEN